MTRKLWKAPVVALALATSYLAVSIGVQICARPHNGLLIADKYDPTYDPGQNGDNDPHGADPHDEQHDDGLPGGTKMPASQKLPAGDPDTYYNYTPPAR